MICIYTSTHSREWRIVKISPNIRRMTHFHQPRPIPENPVLTTSSHNHTETGTRLIKAWIAPERTRTNPGTRSLTAYNSVELMIVVALLIAPWTAASWSDLLRKWRKASRKIGCSFFEHRARHEVHTFSAGSAKLKVPVAAAADVVKGCSTHGAANVRCLDC